ncbi:MAG: hypothetical protein HYZ17_17670 [Betaproteobacteria bacterium]|nr:hypothetical protein [Betaproteobacteria bacterium]
MSTIARVHLLDSLLRGNSIGAVFAFGPTALVSGSRLFNNTSYGLYAYATGAGAVTRVEVSRSEASGNYGGYGFHAYASSSGWVELNVKDSVASRNSFGVYISSVGGTALAMASNALVSGNAYSGLTANGSGAKLVVTGNKVTHNSTGLFQTSSGVLQSTGDNTVTDNTAATSGTITGLANM